MADTFDKTSVLKIDGAVMDYAKYLKDLENRIAVRVGSGIDSPLYVTATNDSGNTNLTTLKDVVNSSVFYLCEARVAQADTSLPIWRICRVSKVGQILRTDFVGAGLYDQICDDRVSLFPPVVVDNTHSIDLDPIAPSDKLDGGDIHQFDSSDPFTFSMYIKPNIATTGTLWAKTTADSNVYGYSLKYLATTGLLQVQMRAPSGLRLHTFTTALVDNVWQRVTWAYNGGLNINGNSVWVEGVKDTSTISNGTINNSWLSGQSFTVGARNTAFFANALVNQMTVWKKAFSDSEEAELGTIGAAGNPLNHSASSDNVGWNKLGTGDSHPTALDNAGTNDLTMINTVTDNSNIVADVP